MNERLFLEILDWNAKMVQCCNNIGLAIYEKKDEEKASLLQAFKIKKPKKPKPGQEIPLIASNKAEEIVNEIGNNIVALERFEENITNINDVLQKFNVEMNKIHQSSTVTQTEREFIHTTAKIIEEKLPKIFENSSKTYAIKIEKVNETLKNLHQETNKDNLAYQKEFSEYLVNCFNYITNAMQQINGRIDSFFGTRNYLKKRTKK